MSKYSVDEKIRYHKERGDSFGPMYELGVTFYRAYPKATPDGKAVIDSTVQNYKLIAKRDKEEFAKAFLSGMRDAARERKEKSRK